MRGCRPPARLGSARFGSVRFASVRFGPVRPRQLGPGLGCARHLWLQLAGGTDTHPAPPRPLIYITLPPRPLIYITIPAPPALSSRDKPRPPFAPLGRSPAPLLCILLCIAPRGVEREGRVGGAAEGRSGRCRQRLRPRISFAYTTCIPAPAAHARPAGPAAVRAAVGGG